MRLNACEADLARIAAADDTFRVTTAENIEPLAASIRLIGLINPPVLHPRGAEFVVLSGFRRIAATRLLGWPSVPARSVPPDAGRLACARLAIAENITQRALNVVETSRALHLLASCGLQGDALRAAAAETGLPDAPGIVQKLLTVSTFAPEIQAGLLQETIPFAMAFDLARQERATAALLVSLFSELRLSLSKQREVLLLVREIASREQLSPLQVLQAPALVAAMETPDLDRSQKTRHLRVYLRQRRYPAIAQSEKRFAERVRALNLDKDLQLLAPPNFEGNIFQFILRFENCRDLHQISHTLKGLADHPTLDAIVKKAP